MDFVQENTEKEASRSPKKRIKSLAKALGEKSVLRFGEKGEKLVITSFGRGHEAFIEKRILSDKSGQQVVKHERNTFGLIPRTSKYEIESRKKEEMLERSCGKKGNPSGSPACEDPRFRVVKTQEGKKESEFLPVRKDLIGAKDALEQRYYGQTFENDNIHIQIIYRILKINKKLAPYINNIIYELNNLHPDSNPDEDLIGCFHIGNTFYTVQNPEKENLLNTRALDNLKRTREWFNKLIYNPRMGYFGKTLYDEAIKKEKNKKKKLAYERKMYYIFWLLSLTRHSLAHGDPKNLDRIYQLEGETQDQAQKEAVEELEKIYQERVDSFNRGFLSTSKVNLEILCGAMEADPKKIVQDYYGFAASKTQKNMGFSVKRVRENMLDLEEARDIQGKKYDSVRSKLYTVLDFLIYQHYKKNGEHLDQLIASLREALQDEEKDRIYQKEGKKLWQEIGENIKRNVLPKMRGKEIANMKNSSRVKPEWEDILEDILKEVKIKAENTHRFSMLLYVLTLFLDGKEINDMLTGLIRNFEEIASFQNVLKNLEGQGIENPPFEQNYCLFADSGKIAEELRLINSFARMTKAEDRQAKKKMFVDAAKVLGHSKKDEKDLEDYFDKLLDNPKRGKNGFRNFLASNVIDSSRFQYIVRYGRPEKMRELAKNPLLVNFVLKELPDNQIERYYEACLGSKPNDLNKARKELADKITKLTFENFEDVKQSAREGKPGYEDKTQKQAMIGLYLMVLYQIVKDLIYVNSRYFLAFYILERDNELLGDQITRNDKYVARTKLFLRKTKGRAVKYLEANLNNSDTEAIRRFRNKVEHLNAIRKAAEYAKEIRYMNSWFGLYHYIIQRVLGENNENLNEKTQEYVNAVNQYHTYSMDFVKALCIPFGYNLARYKNLSIEGLFDRNRPGAGKTDSNSDI